MIKLTGNSLGERQKCLNEKVNIAVAGDFDKYKTDAEENDIDKIFLIDLAAKNKNIIFVLEILKSGDIVHISRALNKCTWLVDDEFTDIFNVDNLHVNVFLSMSIKAKNKLLSTIAMQLNDESRSIEFHEYCMKEKLDKIALKFLFNTPESYKQDVVVQKSKAYQMVLSNKEEAIANFIRNSLSLAEKFLDSMEKGRNRNDVLDLLRYLFSVSGEQYLNLLEKYKIIDTRFSKPIFGSRLSKYIMKKYKTRVLRYPTLYFNLLKEDKIAKNSTVDDVKIYANALLPDETSTFWDINFYNKYNFILAKIPINERFTFLKMIFSKKYPDEKFEMSKEFFSLNFYKMMTTEDQESWALRHITSGEEILGSGNDYVWYKFLPFEKTFEEIKKNIQITADSQRRAKIVNVLIDSSKTPHDLETLLNYYYNRHINEQRQHKVEFLDLFCGKHDVYAFNDACWIALEKLFYSLDLFSSTLKYSEIEFKFIALINYIIRSKTVPAVLDDYLKNNIMTPFEVKTHCHTLTYEQGEMVFQYINKLYLKTVEAFAFKDDVQGITLIIPSYLDLLQSYSRTKEDIAEIVDKYIKIIKGNLLYHKLLKDTKILDFSNQTIMKYMKKDAALVVEEFPAVKKYITDRYGRINWLLRKLKIYFHNDIARQYLQLLNKCISTDDDTHYLLTEVAVYGILLLADKQFKIEFMQKYVPTKQKIDHANISRNLLKVQQSICAYACVSRPPMPMECILQYITGDYVHYCLPLFSSYLMNLPLPLCIQFVKLIIDKPISIQKHGLRLAFQCFSAENLIILINGIWEKTNNVSLRKILYKSLYNKVIKESDKTQAELFKLFNTLTLDLRNTDDDEMFDLVTDHTMPNHLKGRYLLNCWKSVNRHDNYERMTKVLNAIKINVDLIPDNELINLIEDHISKMFTENGITTVDNFKNICSKKGAMLQAKWEITFGYLSRVYNENQLKKNQEMVSHIINKCVEMWNEVKGEKYVLREFCDHFIESMEKSSYDDHKVHSYANMNIMCSAILSDLKKILPEHEIFRLTLRLRISEIARDTIIAGKINTDEKQTKDQIGDVIKTSIAIFAKYFAKLMKEYISKGQFFASFYVIIEDCISTMLNRIKYSLDDNYRLIMKDDDLCVIFNLELLKYEIPELYILVLRSLPVDYEGDFVLEYDTILRTLKSFKNTEIQYFLYEKFVNTDFVIRKGML